MFLSIPPRQVLPSSLACVLMISRLFPFFHKRKQPVCGRVVPCSEDALTGMRACGRVSSQGKRGLRSPAWDRVEAEGNELMVRIEENLLLLLNEHTGLAVGSDLRARIRVGALHHSNLHQLADAICWPQASAAATVFSHLSQINLPFCKHSHHYLTLLHFPCTEFLCWGLFFVEMKQTDVSKKIVWYRNTSDMPLAGPVYLRASNLCWITTLPTANWKKKTKKKVSAKGSAHSLTSNIWNIEASETQLAWRVLRNDVCSLCNSRS